jgi:DNA-binding MarR family transcriptional regulator
MEGKLTEDEIWDLIGFIKVSSTRYNTLRALETDFLMPTEISRRTGIRTTQVSNALHDLKARNLVECKNEHVRKGRIYQITEDGLTILKKLK